MSRIHDALKKAEMERNAATGHPEMVSPAVAEASSMPELAQASPASSQTAPPLPRKLSLTELRESCAKPEWRPDAKMNVFFSPELSTSASEQFRTLRSRLYQLRGDRPLRKLLITSAVAGEGKTFVANNLAQAIVRQPDRRVLLVDADLRCSRLHVLLGAPGTPGLSDYLRGDADETMIVQNSGGGNLYFIPGGTEAGNPSELLANGRIQVLLDRLAPHFDWVILDSPPCLPVADATVLSEHCDGILLVVRAGITPSAAVKRAGQELSSHHVIGTVLNGVAEGALAYGSYYYNSNYYGVERKAGRAAEAGRSNS